MPETLLSPDLNRQVDLSDPTPQCEAAMFNQLYDEQMLGHLVASSIMMPVSCALPDELFFTSGGTTWETAECFPDWSTGNKNRTQRIGRPKAIAIGDTKYQWAHEEAISVVRSNPHGYEYANRRDIVRPIEQLQFYCASYKCRFGFLITEKGLLVLEASLETEIQRSPRPPRNVQPPSHRRVTSSSTVDKSVSGISEALTDIWLCTALAGSQTRVVTSSLIMHPSQL
ncbi:hypothetical protein BDW59DRAFT_177030 [Aspergillus cavernicola]|uniref:Uncharacterized protein n=1 Tax=Aspergillus cavernicola TaxID=176166 RepID=A0ABR4H9J6_9EURO